MSRCIWRNTILDRAEEVLLSKTVRVRGHSDVTLSQGHACCNLLIFQLSRIIYQLSILCHNLKPIITCIRTTGICNGWHFHIGQLFPMSTCRAQGHKFDTVTYCNIHQDVYQHNLYSNDVASALPSNVSSLGFKFCLICISGC